MTPAGYTAVPATWNTAGHGMAETSNTLGTAVDRLCDQLAAAGACWGDDDIGRAFFNGDEQGPGFGATRDAVLGYLADMVNLVRATGGVLTVSGQNYQVADEASTIGAALPAGSDHNALATLNPYRLPPASQGLVTSDPPPPGIVWVLRLLETLVGGCQWPDGDLVAMKAMSEAFRAAGRSVQAVAREVAAHAATVTAANSGAATENFASFAEALRGGGDSGGLAWLTSVCDWLADWVDTLIKQKNAAWLQFELSCAFLIATWILASALSVPTLGGSVATATATTEAEGIALRTLLRGLAKSVLMGAWFGGGLDAVGQYARIQEGLQKGFSFGELAKGTGEGAVAGAVMGGAGAWVGRGGGPFTKALASYLETGGFKGGLTRFAFAGTTGTAGNVAAQAVFDHGHVDLAQAAEFGFGMAGIEGFKGAGRAIIARFGTGGRSFDPLAEPHDDTRAADPHVAAVVVHGGPGELTEVGTTEVGQVPSDARGPVWTADPHENTDRVPGHDVYRHAPPATRLAAEGAPAALSAHSDGIPPVHEPAAQVTASRTVPSPAIVEPVRQNIAAALGGGEQPVTGRATSPGRTPENPPPVGGEPARHATGTNPPHGDRRLPQDGPSTGSSRINALLNGDTSHPEGPGDGSPSHGGDPGGAHLPPEPLPPDSRIPVVGRDYLDTLLRDAGYTDTAPATEVPPSLLRELRPTAMAGPRAEVRSADPARLAADLRAALTGADVDGGMVLARLHELRQDPAAAHRLDLTYRQATGRDLRTDIVTAYAEGRLNVDVEPYLPHLLPDQTMPLEALGDHASIDVRDHRFSVALHDAIMNGDGPRVSALLSRTGRAPESNWSLQDAFRSHYGDEALQRIRDQFPRPEADYLAHLLGEGPLETQVMSVPEVRDLYDRLSNETFRNRQGLELKIPFGFPEGGCYDRAHHMAVKLAEWGYSSRKIFVVRTSPTLVVHSATPQGGDVGWGFHVATVVQVRHETGQVHEVVIDPSLRRGPLGVDEWLGLMGVTRSDYLRFDTTGHLPDQIGSVLSDILVGMRMDNSAALVYSTPREIYSPQQSSPNTLREAHTAAWEQHEVETVEYVRASEARELSGLVAQIATTNGWDHINASAWHVAEIIQHDPAYRMLLHDARTGKAWPPDVVAGTGFPDLPLRATVAKAAYDILKWSPAPTG